MQNTGKTRFPATQAAPSFSSSFPFIFDKKKNIPCLIPCAIDQDPYFRMTRDVAPRLKYLKPCLIHSKFLPALKGASTKASASDSTTTIYLSDTPDVIAKKIKQNAFDGSGDCNKDVAYQYLRYFMEDSKKLDDLEKGYLDKSISSDDLKEELIKVIQKIVFDHQERRKAITADTLRQFMAPRKLNIDFS